MTPLLARGPFISWTWIDENTDRIREQTIEHLQLTVTAVSIGFVLAMGMALVATRWRWSYGLLAGVCGVLYSIPSLALFGFLVPVTGLGIVPAQIALVGYTLLILLRNIVAGIDGVPADVREAADGMGFEPWRRTLRVDLPLALPAIIAGLRIATVTTIGLVTITALVGEGGYGDFISEGLRRQQAPQASTLVIVGTGLSVAMAVVFDLLFVSFERFATPWAGSRRERVAPIDPDRPAIEAEPDAAPSPADATVAVAGSGGGGSDG
ncbi:MAG: ABC transporter permease [Acidimicrobiales bacterium]